MPTLNFPELSKTPKQTSFVRRRLLKLSTTLVVSLPVFTASASRDSNIAYHLVKNQESATGVIKGAIVLVDTSINDFHGDGFYLYPDWGQPIVYEVRQKANRLAFHYPGCDRVLWELSPEQSIARFSGRVEGVLNSREAEVAGKRDQLQALLVPRLPIG